MFICFGISSPNWSVVLSGMHQPPVSALCCVIAQKFVIGSYAAIQLGVFPKILDFEIDVSPKHLHGNAATVGVPPLRVIEFVGDLLSPCNFHLSRNSASMRLGNLPILKLKSRSEEHTSELQSLRH